MIENKIKQPMTASTDNAAKPDFNNRGGDNRGGNNRGGNRPFREEKPKSEYEEHVLQVDRVSRTVKGGKRMRFRALVIIGNRAGKIGMGVGKAAEVVDAVGKATTFAKKHIMEIPIVNDTIPYPIEIHNGAAHVILKPAKAGTSVIAGGTIRVICNLAGIKNLVAKILGTANKINNAQTTLMALEKISAQWKEKNASK
ncbi:MAG: 30S ribosomal protein S5 [Candidatus Berkelbacteria bacterium]